MTTNAIYEAACEIRDALTELAQLQATQNEVLLAMLIALQRKNKDSGIEWVHSRTCRCEDCAAEAREP